MPLRPLTLGELLDAAVVLLRERARTLLAAGFVLSAIEQVVLFPLRRPLAADPPFYLPYADRVGRFWLAFGLGFATEAFIIAMLGGLSAVAAGPALLGTRLSTRQLWRDFARRLPAILTVSVVVAVIAGSAAFAGFLPWIFLYGLIGLVVPALIIDRVGVFGAIGRGVVLGARMGLRATWIRLLGYFGWLALRIALVYGAIAVVDLAAPGTDHDLLVYGAAASWLVINAVAYPMLACLDAVLYLETRMRSEALDIVVGRALRGGRPIDLAATR
jgi:hypothetical protein